MALVFFIVFLPVIAVSFLLALCQVAWHMGRIWARKFSDWVVA